MSYGRESDVISAKAQFQHSDVLYGKLRPYLRKTVVANCDGICSSDILVLRPKSGFSSFYIQFLLHSAAFVRHAIATTAGAQHPRTSWPALGTFQTCVPESATERNAIARVMLALQTAIDIQDRIIDTTRELGRGHRKAFAQG